MRNPYTLTDKVEEQRIVRQRIYIAGIIAVICLILLVLRVFNLQIVMNEHFSTLSHTNRVKVLPIAPIRGLIFSRDGVLLADNRPSFSLEIIPERVTDLDKTIRDLRNLIEFEESDINRFNKLVHKQRRFKSIPLRFNLSEQEVALFSVNRHLYPGVDIIARLNRYYPHAADTVHTIGYVGRIDEEELKRLDESNYSGSTHIGKLGVEKAYEEILHGQVGYQQVEVNAQGRIIRVLDRVPPVAGKNIHLTLDLSLQKVAVDALSGKRGAIVALDPSQGEVLAMVSSPSYDPNPFVNGIDSKSYHALLKSKDTPLLSRVLQGKYPPGSTIKPFLGLAALEFGQKRIDDNHWCPGWYSLKGSEHRYRDWKKFGHGKTDLRKAIVQSCDVYFYSLAYDLGIDRIHKALSQFGFGHKSGIDISGESSGLVPSRDWKRAALNQPWYPGETLIAGIGQGYMLVTPLQLARATSILANKGKLIKPHLVHEIRDSIIEQSIFPGEERPGHMVIKQQKNWDDIIAAMRDVVHGPRGTARRSGLGAAYEFAGKTGTAQVIGIAQDAEYEKDEIAEEHRDHAWFIAFAPVQNPKIAVVILVENGGSGSSSAAPIARILFDHYLSNQSAQG